VNYPEESIQQNSRGLPKLKIQTLQTIQTPRQRHLHLTKVCEQKFPITAVLDLLFFFEELCSHTRQNPDLCIVHFVQF